jgi:hypothetical protein
MIILVSFAPEAELHREGERRFVIMIPDGPPDTCLMARSTTPGNGFSSEEHFDDPTKISPPLAANPAIHVTAVGSNRSDEDYAGEPQLAKEVLAKPSLDRGSGCRSRGD